MKKKIIIGLLVLGFGAIAFAFTNGKDDKIEDRVKRMTQKMAVHLDLDEEQTEKVEAINLDFARKKMALHQEFKYNREAGRDQMKTLKEEHRAALSKVLNEEQMAKVDEHFRKHGRHGRHHMMHSPEMRQAFKKEMYPSLLEKRKELEAELTDDEKATIARLRPVFKAFKQEMKQARESGNLPPVEERKASKEEMKELMQPLKAITENHRPTLEAIHNEMKPKMEAFRESHHPKAEGKEDCKPEKHGHAKRGFQDGGKADMHHKMMVAHFLLMDPNGGDFFDEATVSGPVASVFPNPSAAENTLELELKKAGKVTVALLSQDGNLIRNILERDMNVGSHKIPVTLEDAKAGQLHFYKIQTPEGETLVRFMVVR